MKGNLKVLLTDKLDTEELELVFKSYDIIGDIAVIRIPKPLIQKSELIAEVIMQTHKRVKTVLHQTSPVYNQFRLRKLEWVAGERKTETVYKEYGCIFKVNLEKSYFSPRLSYERMRIAKQVQNNEVVVNMFAGVGCYSILIAKHSRANKIFSIDINPDAVDYMLENTLINKVHDRVVVIKGDAKKVVKNKLKNTADRVLMPLPERAFEYLNYALLTLKPAGGWIHYYDFVHANKTEDPRETVKGKVSKKLQKMEVEFETSFHRVVRRIGPNWFQIVLDLRFVAR